MQVNRNGTSLYNPDLDDLQPPLWTKPSTSAPSLAMNPSAMWCALQSQSTPDVAENEMIRWPLKNTSLYWNTCICNATLFLILQVCMLYIAYYSQILYPGYAGKPMCGVWIKQPPYNSDYPLFSTNFLQGVRLAGHSAESKPRVHTPIEAHFKIQCYSLIVLSTFVL